MKSKSIGSIKNIKITLLALIGTLLLSAEAIADDLSGQDGTSKTTAISNPTEPGEKNKDQEGVSANPAAPTPPKNKGLPYYAKVGKLLISWTEYQYEYSNQARNKFYHAKPTDSVVAAFQRQIGDTLVTNAMLLQEAIRRKLQPDDAFVKQQVEQFERQFANDPNWPDSRARVLPVIISRAQNESMLNQLERLVRKVPSPSVKQLRKYYAAHPEKFTSPQQPRVATILLRMDPAAPDSDWQKATEQAQDLVKRLRAGDDFAELARQYSGDSTAEEGGDMGYLHEGMLPGLPAEVVSKLQPGETSDPVNLMEGIAIFRLIDRKQPELSRFEAVQARAKELWLAEQSDSAWKSLITKLKKSTPVHVDESHFLPLPAASEKASAEKPAENSEASKPALN